MISVVIPVYNEATCLAENVQQFADLLSQISKNDWEIILVNDGSTDSTESVMAKLAEDQHVRGIAHSENQGKGAAVRTGVLATQGDLVLFCDADMSTAPECLGLFLASLESGSDIAVGNRKSQDSVIEAWQPPLRTWLGLRFTWLTNWCLGLSLSDYTCGFKLFRGPVARELFELTESSAWAFDVEVLARASKKNYRIAQIPVRWRHVADTRVKVIRDVIGSLIELISIRRRLGKKR